MTLLFVGIAIGAVLAFTWLHVHAAARARIAVRAFRQAESGEREVELTDGRVYRSEHGISWFRYPDGKAAGLDLDTWLEDQLDEHDARDRWSGERRIAEDAAKPRTEYR